MLLFLSTKQTYPRHYCVSHGSIIRAETSDLISRLIECHVSFSFIFFLSSGVLCYLSRECDTEMQVLVKVKTLSFKIYHKFYYSNELINDFISWYFLFSISGDRVDISQEKYISRLASCCWHHLVHHGSMNFGICCDTNIYESAICADCRGCC